MPALAYKLTWLKSAFHIFYSVVAPGRWPVLLWSVKPIWLESRCRQLVANPVFHGRIKFERAVYRLHSTKSTAQNSWILYGGILEKARVFADSYHALAICRLLASKNQTDICYNLRQTVLNLP